MELIFWCLIKPQLEYLYVIGKNQPRAEHAKLPEKMIHPIVSIVIDLISLVMSVY